MINILPKNFDNLLSHERELWQEAQICFESISKKFKLFKEIKPSIQKFQILTSKSNSKIINAWKVINNKSSFKLCLIQYDSEYTTAGPTGGNTHLDTSLYLFGHLNLKHDFGKALIRPETFKDKIMEFIEPSEIEFKNQSKFNNAYYVLSQDKQKLENGLSTEFFKFMEKVNGLQIEFNNYQCVFRLPNSIDKIESIKLCSIGFILNDILNNY